MDKVKKSLMFLMVWVVALELAVYELMPGISDYVIVLGSAALITLVLVYLVRERKERKKWEED